MKNFKSAKMIINKKQQNGNNKHEPTYSKKAQTKIRKLKIERFFAAVTLDANIISLKTERITNLIPKNSIIKAKFLQFLSNVWQRAIG